VRAHGLPAPFPRAAIVAKTLLHQQLQQAVRAAQAQGTGKEHTMRGRKPQPNALKLLRGNPGRRPLNDREPQHAVVEGTCPITELQDVLAQQEWQRVIASLTTSGHVTLVDRSTLLAYCVKYAQWMRLEMAAHDQPFIVDAPGGTTKPNPIYGMAHKAFQLLLRAAAELGITPSSRSRIISSGAQPAAPDAFTAFQKSRPR